MRGYKTVKLKKSVKVRCSACCGTGILDKDYTIFPCPYCEKGQVTQTEKLVKIQTKKRIRVTLTHVFENEFFPGDNAEQYGKDLRAEVYDILRRQGYRPHTTTKTEVV